MKDETRCPRCGAALPPGGVGGGACLRCLLALGLGPAGPSLESVPALLPPEGGPPGTPERVGPFRILDVLGAGSTGVVSLAEEEGPGRRRVALRVVDPGPDAQEVLARLERERARLAHVSHPGVVGVVGAGVSETGRPWLATEWVPGVPLTEYCDRERFTVRQRLELFVEVAEAVEHAHVGGLLHLNLKPCKVLVAGAADRARPRILDFGVARALDRTLTEQALYSPRALLGGAFEYVSPEQLDPAPAAADARTDVYALGVLLYELLVGFPPFEPSRLRRARWVEIVQVIQHEAPPRPSVRVRGMATDRLLDLTIQRRTDPRRIARELNGDLDWIILQALQKDPSSRYPSARDMGLDLRRQLEGEPIVPGLRSFGRRLLRAFRGQR